MDLLVICFLQILQYFPNLHIKNFIRRKQKWKENAEDSNGREGEIRQGQFKNLTHILTQTDRLLLFSWSSVILNSKARLSHLHHLYVKGNGSETREKGSQQWYYSKPLKPPHTIPPRSVPFFHTTAILKSAWVLLSSFFHPEKSTVVINSVPLGKQFPSSGFQFSPLSNSWNWARRDNITRNSNLQVAYGL